MVMLVYSKDNYWASLVQEPLSLQASAALNLPLKSEVESRNVTLAPSSPQW
jgi:hypothetical protein